MIWIDWYHLKIKGNSEQLDHEQKEPEHAWRLVCLVHNSVAGLVRWGLNLSKNAAYLVWQTVRFFAFSNHTAQLGTEYPHLVNQLPVK